MRSVRFELLRPDEIIQERVRFPVIYLPLGPLEWHSLHLPMGTDPLNAEAVARQVAERIRRGRSANVILGYRARPTSRETSESSVSRKTLT